MIVHNDPLISIYFGDAKESIERDILMAPQKQEDIWKEGKLGAVKKLLHLDTLVLLKQQHGAAGVAISDDMNTLSQDKKEGDFLVTKRMLTGLGVYTADCLPIIYYDTYNRAVGICHAGWLGSVNEIALCALKRMEKEYGTKLDHLRVFFGPSAKACCYQVQDSFTKNLEQNPFKEKVLMNRSDGCYFDLPLFNKLQLEAYGVKKEAFQLSYNICTICDPSYCSNRRDKGSNMRQLTIVALK